MGRNKKNSRSEKQTSETFSFDKSRRGGDGWDVMDGGENTQLGNYQSLAYSRILYEPNLKPPGGGAPAFGSN